MKHFGRYIFCLYSYKEINMCRNFRKVMNLPFGLLKAFIMTLIPMPAMTDVASTVFAATS